MHRNFERPQRKYETFHGVVFDDEALTAAVKLSAKHLHDRKLPDKAIDLIDEAAAGVKLIPANDDMEAKELPRFILRKPYQESHKYHLSK